MYVKFLISLNTLIYFTRTKISFWPFAGARYPSGDGKYVAI